MATPVRYFQNGSYYHVYNRGNRKQNIFLSHRDYERFLKRVKEYKEKFKISILGYCLMPNHFHFLLKQVTDKGISAFMTNLQNSYVKYFNVKNERAGPLFQSMFKAVIIETDEQLLHVSRYIHLNPSTAYVIEPENLEDYKWSSLNSYLDKNFNSADYFVNPKIVLSFFKKRENYEKFVLDQASYQRELDKIKHLTLE